MSIYIPSGFFFARIGVIKVIVIRKCTFGSIVGLLLISACSSSAPSNLNEGRISIINEQVQVNNDRIIELERMITELSQRVEKIEFINLERKDQIKGQMDAQIVAPASDVSDSKLPSNDLNQPELPVKILNRTSAIIPLAIMDQHRAQLVELEDDIDRDKMSMAYDHLEQNQFANAWKLLEQIDPEHLSAPWQAKLLFWRAVCFEAMKEDRQAIKVYTDLQAKFKKDELAPLALFRQASIFLRSDERELYRLTLGRLVSTYPQSPEAVQARTRLKEMR